VGSHAEGPEDYGFLEPSGLSFLSLLNLWIALERSHGSSNESKCHGIGCAPTDSLVIGVSRVLGRGISFQGISESNRICEEVTRVFVHIFCESCANDRYKSSCCIPDVSTDLDRVVASQAGLGIPGCISSNLLHSHSSRSVSSWKAPRA
jgi:hypothetical protein